MKVQEHIKVHIGAASFMKWSVSIFVPTVYIAVSIRDQQLHHVQLTFPVDKVGGYISVSDL